jgi:hypothetical protein
MKLAQVFGSGGDLIEPPMASSNEAVSEVGYLTV